MNAETVKNRLPELLKRQQAAILEEWMKDQLKEAGVHSGGLSEAEVREQSRSLLQALMQGSQQGGMDDLSGPQWAPLRELLADISHARARAGSTPAAAARFVFSLKQALFG